MLTLYHTHSRALYQILFCIIYLFIYLFKLGDWFSWKARQSKRESSIVYVRSCAWTRSLYGPTNLWDVRGGGFSFVVVFFLWIVQIVWPICRCRVFFVVLSLLLSPNLASCDIDVYVLYILHFEQLVELF